MIPSNKAKFIFGFAGTTLSEIMSPSAKLVLSTPTGFIFGRPVLAKGDHDNEMVKTHCVIMEDIKKDNVTEKSTSKGDGCIILEDVDVLTAPGQTFHLDAMTVFLDQVIGVSIGELRGPDCN